MKNISNFTTSGYKQIRLAKKDKIVLSQSMLDRINKKLGEALARREILERGINSRQSACENARHAAGGEKTVSVHGDPPDWETYSFEQKRNEWVLPKRDDEEEEEDEDEDEDGTVAEVEDSSDSSTVAMNRNQATTRVHPSLKR